MQYRFLVCVAALIAAPAFVPLAAQTASPAAAPNAEDARLSAFLASEFLADQKLRPQLATRLGSKEGADRFDDISDAGQLQRLEWRRASVARMKAQFDRAKLWPEMQVNYDIWALELDRAELGYKFRLYSPPFYSFLYSIHSQLPDFLINTHTISDAADARSYIGRLKALPAALDVGIGQSRKAEAAGIHAPKYQIERVIAGSTALVSGAPFDGGPDAPLWADFKGKVGKLQAAGKVSAADADALLADGRAALLGIKPAYQRVIAWAQGDLPTAPSGRVGAISLPDGAAYYAAALKLNTT